MGISGLIISIPVLGGYVAYSIADRPGLAPGMIGAFIANQYKTGFLGAIVVGFIAGYVVKALKQLKLPKKLSSVSTIFIFSIVGTFITQVLSCG